MLDQFNKKKKHTHIVRIIVKMGTTKKSLEFCQFTKFSFHLFDTRKEEEHCNIQYNTLHKLNCTQDSVETQQMKQTTFDALCPCLVLLVQRVQVF